MTWLRRYERWVWWASLAVIALSVLLLLRWVPKDDAVEAIRRLLDRAGPWTYAAFIGSYVLTALLLLPAWPFTVAAGAALGLWRGALLAWCCSMLAIAVGFVLARAVLHKPIHARIRRNATLTAIDQAVNEGGWKIVALARLSPVIPFGAQNYLYGATGIGFGPCMLVSAVTMVPGTFLFAYAGSLAAAGAEAAKGGAAELALQVVGFVATVAVAAYITRLARRKLREQVHEASQEPPMPDTPRPTRLWPTAALAAAAVALLIVSVYAQANPALVGGLARGLFGPMQVAASEAFADQKTGATFDHSAFDAVLKRVVDGEGMVDYRALKAQPDELRAYLDQLAAVDLDALSRDEKLALLINAYNAFTLQLILDHDIPASIRDIPENQRWKADRWKIGRYTMSLDEIEHEWLRVKFVEPRLHFAIVCASIGCPPLRAEAYTAARIDEQLDDQMRRTHTGQTRWFRFDPARKTIHVAQVYDWFKEDFLAAADSVPAFVGRYVPQVKALVDAGTPPRVAYVEWDWALNIRD